LQSNWFHPEHLLRASEKISEEVFVKAAAI